MELSELKVGDLLLVKENEKIPADGLILSEALVDESMITGESRAVNKKQMTLFMVVPSIKTNHLR